MPATSGMTMIQTSIMRTPHRQKQHRTDGKTGRVPAHQSCLCKLERTVQGFRKTRKAGIARVDDIVLIDMGHPQERLDKYVSYSQSNPQSAHHHAWSTHRPDS